MIIPPDILLSRQRHADIPVKHRGSYFEDWKPYNRASEAALASAEAFCETFPLRCSESPSEDNRELLGRGLVLVGPHSAGKTTLGSIILNELSARNVEIFYVSFPAYVHGLTDQIGIKRQADAGVPEAVEAYWKYEALKRRTYESPGIFLDEVGKEYRTSSGFAEAELDRLLRWRHQHAFPTLAATNDGLEKWGDMYTPSMGGFVYEIFDEVLLGGKNLRQQ